MNIVNYKMNGGGDTLYDYVIVGGGPAGLTLAWMLGVKEKGNRVLVIEREKTLGGCHRVRRVDGVFTEHGPRIYGQAYLNFFQIFEEMGGDLDQAFAPYRFSMTTIGGRSAYEMKWNELLWLGYAYAKLLLNPNYGRRMTIGQFMKNHRFSPGTYDQIDRICRLTDGAGAERYTLFEFLSLADSHAFYPILQPTRPNDLGIIRLWEKALTGRVDLMLGTSVSSINQVISGDQVVAGGKGERKIDSLTIRGLNGERKRIRGKNFILAIPPQNIVELLKDSNDGLIAQAFGPLNQYANWAQKTQYLDYIPVIFHWNHKIKLPKIYGFTKSEWGLVYIVLTDYMKFDHPDSKLVISTCLTIPNVPSKVTGKTYDQSNQEELVAETFRQLKEAYPNLPEPTKTILSPGVRREGNRWRTRDTAYILTPAGYTKKQKSPIFNNLYNVGNHNGHHKYEFTSLEGAVTNAMVLGNKLVRGSENQYKLQSGWRLTSLIRIVLILLVVGIIWYKYFK